MSHSAMQFNTNALYQLVTQVGHGFAVGEVVRFDGTEFVLASSLAEATAAVVGVVSSIESSDQFYLSETGFIAGLTVSPTEGGAFVPGTQYYLSETDGELTSIAPAIEVPCFIAYTSTSGFFARGIGLSAGMTGANTALSNLTATGINQSLISGLDDTDNLGSALKRWADLYAVGIKTGETIGDDLTLSAHDVDGAVDKNFITLTAGNIPTCVFNGDITSTTQAPSDSSTKLATTEYVDDAVTASTGANVQLSNLAAVAVNTSLVSDTDITDDLGSPTIRWDNVYAQSVSTGDTNGDVLTVSGYDVDGATYVDFLTVTAGNTPTAVLNGDVTSTTQAPLSSNTKLATTQYVDSAVVAGTGAPIGATYITQTPNASLTNEQALSALATGILKSTTATGVISIAAQGTDYYAPGGTDVALLDGGTNASLVASNGGIFYSTAAAGAILAGTATARQMLQSGASTTPAWSTATYPATTTVNRILYSSAANVISEITTVNSGVLVTSGAGVPSIATAIPNGVTATTQAFGTSNTTLATTAFVQAAREQIVNAQTLAYTALAADLAKVIRYTGAGGVDLALDPAATLTDGWFTTLRNDSSGTITINPNGAETINGAATLAVSAGKAVIIYTNGTLFYTVGENAASSGGISFGNGFYIATIFGR